VNTTYGDNYMTLLNYLRGHKVTITVTQVSNTISHCATVNCITITGYYQQTHTRIKQLGVNLTSLLLHCKPTSHYGYHN